MFGSWTIPDVQFVSLTPRQFDDPKNPGRKREVLMALIQWMGGSKEYFVNPEELIKSPFGGLSPFAKGTISGHFEMRTMGKRQEMVPVPTKFVAAEAKVAPRAAAGFARVSTLVVILTMLICGFAASAFGDPFVVRNTNSVFDGKVIETTPNGDGSHSAYQFDSATGFECSIYTTVGGGIEFIVSDGNTDQFLAYSAAVFGNGQFPDPTVFTVSYVRLASGGFLDDGDGKVYAWGGLADYVVPFLVPEPVSGALALGCVSPLAVRRRS